MSHCGRSRGTAEGNIRGTVLQLKIFQKYMLFKNWNIQKWGKDRSPLESNRFPQTMRNTSSEASTVTLFRNLRAILQLNQI